jgi:hypothetical protein
MKALLAAAAVALAAVLGVAYALAQDRDENLSDFEAILSMELDPASQAVAAELTRLSGTPRLFDEILPRIADDAKTAFIRANPHMQLGIIGVVDRVAISMVGRRPELDAHLARIWAAAFTAEEMQDLIDFYSSETGQKYAQLLPQVLALQSAAAQRWGQSVTADLTQRVRSELQAAVIAEERALTGPPPVSTPAEGQPQ